MAEKARGMTSTSEGKESIDFDNEVFKTSVRIPPFWPEEPEIWFAQVEGQFAINRITSDQTKFNHIINQLDNKYSREVKDIIIHPPEENKYETLKALLIKRLTESNEKKLKQLLMHEELGDRKPSRFLRHLQSLAGSDVPNDFLKTIWISRLPYGTQTVLAGQPGTATLEDLSDLADRVYDLATSTPAVASVSQENAGSLLSDLTREVAELRKQIQKLGPERSGRSRCRSTRPRRQSSSRQRSQSLYRKYPICWYHGKFGDRASKCMRPCDFKAENSMGGR
ncbi:uncharacterized protein LOC119839404 [Zerene cesonia]|uniref:uncharacterized protein LOC119839404 n=1 Tax=Zerene cesonia TaxID=33412 RepID=UPI0018E58B67|nr:uncharacterized protein LOC119839404 [Zerene cesonia]